MIAATALMLQGTAAAQGDVSLDFGGWSKHFNELGGKTGKLISYNETHDLIGFRYTFDSKSYDNIKYSYAVNRMNDSFDHDAFTAAASAYYSFDLSSDFYLDLGLVGGLQNRSFIKETFHDRVDFRRGTVPFIAPEIKLGFKRLYGSLMVVPTLSHKSGDFKLKEPVVFFQIGFNFLKV